ncbi:hypothetical protein UFOVP822_7 [uncultured Caudovirales phage]|uniref:Uncharacterized protein n=1 Tax=uncultured Caudovirales phage TaxID=2100421 RepID=A0A6J5P7K7_9CAUD|nr:hypothetical protein UFOVP822_7 [uncultured Caudovirales phage]
MLGNKLKKLTESYGITKTAKFLGDAIREKKISKHSISIRQLAESFLGHNWAENLYRYNSGVRVQEASEGVDASSFTAITGQLLVNEIKDKFDLAKLIGDDVCETIPVTNGNLKEQKVPWLSNVIDSVEKVEEGMPYPHTTFSPNYIEYPAIEKIGKICAVTMEAIYSDLTGQILDSAGSVGTYCGLAREERILKVVLGLVNNHKWNGNSYNTYLSSGAWTNTVGNFVLKDWTSVNTLEQLFTNMLDPNTGKNILIEPKQMLVMPANRYRAIRAFSANVTRSGDFATSGNPDQIEAPNPLDKDYQILTSPHARRLLTESGVSTSIADSYVFLGDFKKAFIWREAKPLTVVEAPAQNPREFEQDIALAVKASLMGVAAVRDPRYVVFGIND